MNVLLPQKGKLNQTEFVALYIIMHWEQCIINKAIVDSSYGVLLQVKYFFKVRDSSIFSGEGTKLKQTPNRNVTLIN